ncbi:cysteine proteinase [Stipitochalara longipes BDJ]|nr:cysteine proteinase [Stipitochalara longipes BDJ]
MSPVATNGPPHARGSSVNGGVPINATNGVKPSGMDGMKGTNRVFSHLDDLLAARPDADVNWPMRRLLQEGELLAKQADTHLDFKRPDVALQEYIKASIVAVELIPRHKDYPSLQTDRGDLHRLYNGLNKRITAQHEKFAGVKQVIKENNARSGVKSSLQIGAERTQGNGVPNGHARTQSSQSPATNGSVTNGTPPRQKPPVQPKPDALHGNAIRPQSGGSIPNTDLAARFANLRTPEPKQDPRIRTQPILVPALAGSTTSPVQTGNYTTMNKATGPRDFPSVPRTIPRSTPLPLGVNIPSMPKPPAAVYDSPIRGPEAASANLLSSRSSSYKINGNKASAPPISTVGPTPTQVDNRTDYFDLAQPAHTSGDDGYSRKQPKRAPVLSDSPTVLADELVDLLKQSSQSFRVLLVDLRSREEFDTGHIMSQFIICVEPITLRRGISGEELAESMVIAPDLEQDLYDQRDEFDLIVFYDQSSDSLKSSKSGNSETQSILNDFVSAVYEYGYDKRTKRRPKLLSGGIEAWVDLLGPNSLKTSLNGANLDAARSGLKSGRPLSRTSLGRAHNLPMKRRRTYSSRPLTKEEEQQWDSTLKEESVVRSPAPDDSLAEDLVYARTTEDFFRRYPELPVIQESMIKPMSTSSAPRSHDEEFTSMVPRPPARPAPALPRQRSSGISERGLTAQYAHTAGDTITQPRVVQGLTGLQNPNNLCYMNATLQIISATPFLRDMLLRHQHPPPIPIPSKEGETSAPLQLMVRSLSNLLNHLWAGQYDFVTPNTVRKYINTLHVGNNIKDSRIRERAFGGSARQHDSMEFFLWLFNVIADETNPRRNIPEWNLDNPLEINSLNADPSVRRATSQFRKKKLYNVASELIDRTDIMEMGVVTCKKCKASRRSWQNNNFKMVTVKKEPPVQRLVDALARDTGIGTLEEVRDFGCESCGTLNPDGSAKVVFGGKDGPVLAEQWRFQVWLPDYLWINLNRYDNALQKIETLFTFPEKGLDLSSTFVPEDPPTDYQIPRQQQGPFKYDVYAVIQHGGSTIAGGHYWTLQRSPDKPTTGGNGSGAWHKFNDSVVTPASFRDTQTSNTSAIFLVRQGAPL